MGSKTLWKSVVLSLLTLVSLVSLIACKTRTVEVTRKVVVTQDRPIPIYERVEVTSTPTPTDSWQCTISQETLVVCMSQEPDSLYLYGDSSLAQAHVLEAIYDGPIDNRNFDYQPVILEKLPSLADGDALTQAVAVQMGDWVVDNNGDLVELAQGVRVRPAGCYDYACSVQFDGDPIEMEQMVVTFTLKEEITWSDGQPLTVHDSVYSYELAKHPDTPKLSKYVEERTASYEAQDDYTVVWTGLPGYRDPTYFTNFWTPLPKHLWGHMTPAQVAESEEANRWPVSYGPFVIKEWIEGDYISLSPNSEYFRSDEGMPYTHSTVIYVFVGEDPDLAIAAALSGDCDILTSDIDLHDQAHLLIQLENAGELVPAFRPGAVWENAVFGIEPIDSYERPDFFNDVRTRQAIAMCMDRQKIVDSLLYGRSVVLGSYVPPNHPLYNSDVPQYPYNPAAGSALLEKVGWIDHDDDPRTPRIAQSVEGVPDGILLEFNYWTTTAALREQSSQVLQASMAECGIGVNLEYWEPSGRGPEPPPLLHPFDMKDSVWLTGYDPPCELYLCDQIPSQETSWTGQNISGFCHSEYDAACKAALQALPGEPEYEYYHKEAQRIFAEQLPVVPLFMRVKIAAYAPGVTGFIVDSTARSGLWNIEAIDINW